MLRPCYYPNGLSGNNGTNGRSRYRWCSLLRSAGISGFRFHKPHRDIQVVGNRPMYCLQLCVHGVVRNYSERKAKSKATALQNADLVLQNLVLVLMNLALVLINLVLVLQNLDFDIPNIVF
jgi:hypothetical protein